MTHVCYLPCCFPLFATDGFAFQADKNGEERYEVTVEAYDEGSPVMSSTATVVIRNK